MVFILFDLLAAVRMAGKDRCAMSVHFIRAACTAPATSLGTASVTRAGEVCSAIRILTTALTIDPARMAAPASTPVRDSTPACVHQASVATIVKRKSTHAMPM